MSGAIRGPFTAAAGLAAGGPLVAPLPLRREGGGLEDGGGLVLQPFRV